jgi:hypothetical protein
VRNPFPGNKIPANLINPIAQKVTSYMPLPNRAAPAGQRYGTNNLFLPGYFDADKFYNLILKFDWNFGDKHRAYFRHASNDRTEDRAVNGIDNKPGTDGQQPFQRINDAYVLDWVSTINPTTIFNIRASYNRFIEKGYGRANEGFDLGSFGLPGSLLSQIPGGAYFGRWNFYSGNSGTTAMYNSLGRGQSNNYTNTYQLVTSLTKIWGSHSVKMGMDMRQINWLQQNTGDILSFNAYAGPTSRIWNAPDSTSGDAFASFLLGIPEGSSNYPVFPWWRGYYFAPYIHDDWKITRRLTLNIGLRWDLYSPTTEKWNRINGPFDPTVASPIAQQIPANMLAQYPELRNLKGSLTFAGQNGVGTTPAHFNKGNFQPRFGAAYQMSNRWVMRGGVGLSYSNPNNDYNQNAGFQTSTALVNTNDGGRTYLPNILSNPYPSGISVPTGASAGALTFVGRNNDWFNSNFKIPALWSYSFGFQYQVTQASTLDFSYVGSYSYNLNSQKDYNLPSLDFRKQCNAFEGGSGAYCDQQVPNPFKGIEAFRGTSFFTADTLSRFQMARPFPQFNGNLTERGLNSSHINYNSLQVNYNFRFHGGLNLLGNYTWSKQIETWGYNDPYTDVQQKSLYFLDRPHVIKLTTVYDLPFGDGKKWGASAPGFVRKLTSGWTFTTFLTDPLKGFPADLPGNVIQLRDSSTPGGGWDGNIDWKAYQVRAWNPCVLRQFADNHIEPMPYSVAKGCGDDYSQYAWLWTYTQNGNGPGYQPRYTSPRSGQIRRHHAFTYDASITKRTKITERLSAQFGVEAFNLFNHNYFGRDQYNTDPNSPNFGTIFPSLVSTQNSLPRQIQIRMKLTF